MCTVNCELQSAEQSRASAPAFSTWHLHQLFHRTSCLDRTLQIYISHLKYSNLGAFFHVQLIIIHWITVIQHLLHVKVLWIVPKVVGKCVSDFFTLNPAVLFFIWRAMGHNNYQEINQRYTPQNCRPHLYFACYVSCSIQ